MSNQFFLFLLPTPVKFMLSKGRPNNTPKAFTEAYVITIDGPTVTGITVVQNGIEHPMTEDTHAGKAVMIDGASLQLVIGANWTSRPCAGIAARALMEAMHQALKQPVA